MDSKSGTEGHMDAPKSRIILVGIRKCSVSIEPLVER